MTNKTQWQKRIDVFRYVMAYMSNRDYSLDNNYDSDQIKVINYFRDELDNIVNLVKKYIAPNHSWASTKEIDKAIIVSAYSEFKALNTPRNVIIDQAITTAKNYSSANSYKFINAILDKILK